MSAAASDEEGLPEVRTVYHLRPTEVEFFQRDEQRRHVRLRYRWEDASTDIGTATGRGRELPWP
ncbi:pyridoxine 5'-phosphate oxidase C-terminal domain-containing protein [Streptomyces sp. NPDC127066]|uniref:pyridoxine 5'-phosphate oxidase C-terminal domain-containing protein n=1 Tax=Streptomyces sp. NPDC127066 TaxID=3347125 RepID=UPI00364BB9D4